MQTKDKITLWLEQRWIGFVAMLKFVGVAILIAMALLWVLGTNQGMGPF